MYTFLATYAILVLNITDQKRELYMRSYNIFNFNFEEKTDTLELISQVFW